MIKKLHSLTSRERAFTLVELLIVIAIIGILTLAFLPNILKAPAKARDAIRVKQISDIANSVEVYATEKGNPPDEAGVFCFGAPITGAQPLDVVLGITAPKDSKNLNSCNAVVGSPDVNKFYYRFQSVTDGTDPPFYIVGTKLEASSAANTWATFADGGGGGATGGTPPSATTTPCGTVNGVSTVITLACARALLNTTPDAANTTEFWRIAVGPQ